MEPAYAVLMSPIGPLRLRAAGGQLRSLDIGAVDRPRETSDALLREAVAQLSAWFEGQLTDFDLPLEPVTTPRGPAHRAAILGIGYGETASYGQIARMLGSSPRAVGQACARNPLPIIIPCHRVLGAAGAIGHYSAGEGVATKRWLLNHEQTHRKGR